MKLTLFICLLLAGLSGNALAAGKDSNKTEIKKCETKYKTDVQKKKACIAKVKKAKATSSSKVAKSTTATSKSQIKKCEKKYKTDVQKRKACIAKVKKTKATSSSKAAKYTTTTSKSKIKKCETKYKADAKKKRACIAEVKKAQVTATDKVAKSSTANSATQTKQCETKYKKDSKKKDACIAEVKRNEESKQQGSKLSGQQESIKATEEVNNGKANLAQIKQTSSKTLKSINVNTATAAEMASSLPGVGATKAKAIVDYRKQNGKFKSASDLAKVRGLGEKSVANMKPYLKY